MPPDSKIKKEIRRALKDLDWSPGTIDTVMQSLEAGFDGIWSWGTSRMMVDLGQVYNDLIQKYGEPPDNDW